MGDTFGPQGPQGRMKMGEALDRPGNLELDPIANQRPVVSGCFLKPAYGNWSGRAYRNKQLLSPV